MITMLFYRALIGLGHFCKFDLAMMTAGRAGSSGSLECQLVCEALGLYPSTSHELEMDEEGWALCWSCPLLFSDDAARCVEGA
jgi:hypothetical protein